MSGQQDNLFWGFSDRPQLILTFLGFIADATAIITLFWVGYSQGNKENYIAIIVLSILNISLVILFYISVRDSQKKNLKYLKIESKYRDYIDNINTLETKVKDNKSTNLKEKIILHNIIHQFRIILNRIIKNKNSNDMIDYLEIKHSSKEYFLFLLSNIKELFDVITKDECSVCIKMIIDENNIKTLYRDPVSFRTRSLIDNKLSIFPISSNTAFEKILDNFSESYYISNDLSAEESYKNINSQWKKNYNAVLVVPVRIPIDKEKFLVYGFLCVDNINGGFDQGSINLLSSIGDLLFNLFDAMGSLSPPPEPINTTS